MGSQHGALVGLGRLTDALVSRVARAAQVSVEGELLGSIEHARSLTIRREEIVRVSRRLSPDGPAENALIRLVHFVTTPTRGRYISWIGYSDLDDAKRANERWQLVEPSTPYQATVEWHPFGWK